MKRREKKTGFMGMFQILAEPIILSFANAGTLGTSEIICASGMLVSGIILDIKGIKSHYVRTLSTQNKRLVTPCWDIM